MDFRLPNKRIKQQKSSQEERRNFRRKGRQDQEHANVQGERSQMGNSWGPKGPILYGLQVFFF